MDNEKVLIYTYDTSSNVFTGSEYVDADHTLTVGETDVAPENGLYSPITFNGTKFVGVSAEAHEAQIEKNRQAYLATNPVPNVPENEQITQLQELVMSQSADIAQLKQELADTKTTTSTTTTKEV